MVTTPSLSSDQTDGNNSIITAGWQLIKIALHEATIIAIGLVWAGFWLLILRIHAKRGEIAGVIGTGVVAMIGMVLVLQRIFQYINADSLPRPVEGFVAQLSKRAEQWDI
ncbi:MAG: hypothetical protein ABEH65_09475 [Halobacteriales archaeon]